MAKEGYLHHVMFDLELSLDVIHYGLFFRFVLYVRVLGGILALQIARVLQTFNTRPALTWDDYFVDEDDAGMTTADRVKNEFWVRNI